MVIIMLILLIMVTIITVITVDHRSSIIITCRTAATILMAISASTSLQYDIPPALRSSAVGSSPVLHAQRCLQNRKAVLSQVAATQKPSFVHWTHETNATG